MKKLFKTPGSRKSKAGFTLLETLLATCIMVIVSTMLLNGFVTTMGYSYHTSVYNLSAASNYATCMNQLAYWHNLDTEAQHYDVGMAAKISGRGEDNPIKVSFTGGGLAETSLKSLNITTFSQKGNDLGVGTSIGSVDESYGDSQDGSYANNRTMFFYYPTVNSSDRAGGENVGKTRVYRMNSTGKYYWGYVNDAGNIVIICEV